LLVSAIVASVKIGFTFCAAQFGSSVVNNLFHFGQIAKVGCAVFKLHALDSAFVGLLNRVQLGLGPRHFYHRDFLRCVSRLLATPDSASSGTGANKSSCFISASSRVHSSGLSRCTRLA